MSSEMPRDVSVRFTHASMQAIAELAGVDLLHIKGPAVDESLLDLVPAPSGADGERQARVARMSVDADILVRPSHVRMLIEAMHAHDWTTAYDFEDGSPFEHAATLTHPILAPVDVHQRFPGIGQNPESAFEHLWRERHRVGIAGIPCSVPSVTAQRLILILHAAREGTSNHPDIRRGWTTATDAERSEVVRLAALLGAEVPLAAGTGRLDQFAGAREYRLWKLLSSRNASPVRVWIARIQAEPDRRAAARLAVRLLVPNAHRLQVRLGRPPTRIDLARAYLQRIRWGLAEIVSVIRNLRDPGGDRK